MVGSEMADILGVEAGRADPKTVREALGGAESEKWLDLMEAEIENIDSKGTWVEAKLLLGRKAIGCKWVFKVKEDADGNVVKYKLRFVAQGFSQVSGVDFEETFAPVSRTTSLNGKLDVEMYMRYPEGMVPRKGCDALRLVGSLSLGFKRCESDWGLYYRPADKNRGPALLLGYVDDLGIGARTVKVVSEIIDGLKKRWKITKPVGLH